jgi:DNA polymerase III delta prime subunit
MIITGSHGFGKTVSIDVILKELDYNIHYLDIKKIKLCKDISSIVTKSMISPNILSIMSNAEVKQHIIVVDNLESITSSTEKASILNLQKMNDLNWYCPIIFISNNRHNKLLSDIKKFSHEVKFYPPYASNLRDILLKIATNESIQFENGFVVDKIINYSQGDIRQLIFILYDLKYAHNVNKTITLKSIQEYGASLNMRDIDIDLFKATNKLLQNYKNVNTCMSLYETEKVLLPLMMQQNYPECIIQNYDDNDDRYMLCQTVSDSLSMGDITENYIYGEQNWSMQDIHGIFTCVIPSYYINMNDKNKRTEFSSSFPVDLNKTSIKSINKKNIVNTDQCLKNMNIFDYMFVSKIIYNYIVNNNIEECIKLLLGYNIEMEYIESLLKINKIRSNKSCLTMKQKKEFVNYIELYKNKIK